MRCSRLAAAAVGCITSAQGLLLPLSPPTSQLLPTTKQMMSSSSINVAGSNVSIMDSTPLSQDHPLRSIQVALQNSWIQQLSPETPHNLERSREIERLPSSDDNRRKRPVFNGHYVLVKPTGLRQPQLLLWSSSVADDLHINASQMNSDAMLQWLSGNLNIGASWATPYALSIVGQRYTSNCPYGTGDGYGDGRAIVIGELHDREIQGKGMGRTPFSRGADGRAVLRSSIREFLASEGMHHLGVPTTRALSLVVSNVDTVNRPWYSEAVDNTTPFTSSSIPSLDDPRLARYPLEQRQQILQQLRQQKSDPDRMIQEPCAITTRVSSSFLRVGHVDLFARRAMRKYQELAVQPEQQESDGAAPGTYVGVRSTLEWQELEEIIWHACYREYREEAYEPFHSSGDLASASDVLLRRSAEKLASMVSHWIRVGFSQGNFNGDNCLVGGYTMDYGPFGFLEEYQPLFAKWTGSGQHFGFLNQMNAGYANYQILVESVLPVIAAAKNENFTVEDMDEIGAEYMESAKQTFQRKLDETFRVKLGLREDDAAGDELWEVLEPLMRSCRVDWTLFWRQLTYVTQTCLDASVKPNEVFSQLEGSEDRRPGSSPFYEPISEQHRNQWMEWLERWRVALKLTGSSSNEIFERMGAANPKYILREWMLVDAYSAAGEGDYALLHELYQLIRRPYEEGGADEERQYYRRAPEEVLTKGGTAFMS